ncbi:hypothetical protein [Ensifer sp. MJa1]
MQQHFSKLLEARETAQQKTAPLAKRGSDFLSVAHALDLRRQAPD